MKNKADDFIQTCISQFDSDRARTFWDIEYDEIKNYDLKIEHIVDPEILTVGDWMGGMDVLKAMNVMYTLALITKCTVVSSLNGHLITINPSRHQ